jgi:hypothetical protein
MHAHDMTDWHRADLEAQQARARERVESLTSRAKEAAKTAPASDPDDKDLKLWNMGGYYAFIFCLWFAFLAPIVLILINWN